VFFVFTLSRRAKKHVIANEVHRRKRLAAAVKRGKDDLWIVIFGEGYDDKLEVLEYGIGQSKKAHPRVRLHDGKERFGAREKKPVSGKWGGVDAPLMSFPFL
jgi:hypothetical protein